MTLGQVVGRDADGLAMPAHIRAQRLHDDTSNGVGVPEGLAVARDGHGLLIQQAAPEAPQRRASTHTDQRTHTRRVDTSGPVCSTFPDLFDSTDELAHAWAALACSTCPLRATWCTPYRDGLLAKRMPLYGTWAGMLLDGTVPPARNRGLSAERARQVEAEDDAYDEELARQAHRQYARGLRDEWTVTGEHVWQRRRKRAARAASKAA